MYMYVVVAVVFPAMFNCMSFVPRVEGFILTKGGGLVKRRAWSKIVKQGGNYNNCKSWSLCWINKKKRGTYIWATRGNELEDRIVLSENDVFGNGIIAGIQLLLMMMSTTWHKSEWLRKGDDSNAKAEKTTNRRWSVGRTPTLTLKSSK